MLGQFRYIIRESVYILVLYDLFNRMLQHIALPISEAPTPSIRAPDEGVVDLAPDEGVVDLARACLPFLEMGTAWFSISVPQLNLSVEPKNIFRLFVRSSNHISN